MSFVIGDLGEFLDMKNYVSADTYLDEIIKAYGGSESKGVFP